MTKDKTIVIDNFRGPMTIYQYGDINSGRSYVQSSSGANPFVKPGQLTWNESPVQINPNEDVITDLIMAAKERVESGISYVYAIGHTGRLYKIQVNNPSTYNPDYDNAVLLATLAINSPTFTRGGFIDFFGSTQKIYIGHDKGLTSISFDGTGEAFVGVLGTWTQNVPRPLKQFVGKLYIGNGSNLAEVDSTLLVTTYTKLSPGFPDNSQVRDIDLSPDGNYMEIVVSNLTLPDITLSTQNTTSIANSDSYIFKWNGTDTGYTSFNTFPSLSLNANILFQNYQYTFGYEQLGTAVFNPLEKIMSMPEAQCPMPNAIFSTSNIVGYLTPVTFNGTLEIDLFLWGSTDFEVGHPLGFWDTFFMNAKSPQTDIILVPLCLPISNVGIGSSSNGYTNNVFSTSKIYFSTLETSSSTTKYRFYRWSPISSPDVASSNILVNAYYQTQTQMFSKKVNVSEVRIYAEPWIAGNSFQIDLIGSSGLPIANASYTFTAGSTLTIGNDYAWYTPSNSPTYAIGVAITNLGSTNHVINKIELDWSPAGK